MHGATGVGVAGDRADPARVPQFGAGEGDGERRARLLGDRGGGAVADGAVGTAEDGEQGQAGQAELGRVHGNSGRSGTRVGPALPRRAGADRCRLRIQRGIASWSRINRTEKPRTKGSPAVRNPAEQGPGLNVSRLATAQRAGLRRAIIGVRSPALRAVAKRGTCFGPGPKRGRLGPADCVSTRRARLIRVGSAWQFRGVPKFQPAHGRSSRGRRQAGRRHRRRRGRRRGQERAGGGRRNRWRLDRRRRDRFGHGRGGRRDVLDGHGRRGHGLGR